MTEAALTRKILAALRAQGGFWEKRSPGAFTKSGIADIVGCFKGRFIAIEVKLPGRLNTVTPAQWAYLNSVADNGGTAITASSVDVALSDVWSSVKE